MQPDDIDKLFREGLGGHRTPPPRALWERLEDELHPPKVRKRAGAWWPMALAASVLLLVLAGGAGLWDGWPRAGRGPQLAGRNQRASGRPDAKAAPATRAQPTATQTAAAGSRQDAGAAAPVVAAGPAATRNARRRSVRTAAAPAAGQPGATPVEMNAVAAVRPAARGKQSRQSILARQERPISRPAAELAAGSEKIFAGRATRPTPAASSPPNAGSGARQSEKPLPSTFASAPQPAAPAVAIAAATTPAAPSDLASPAAVIEVDVRRGGPTLARLTGVDASGASQPEAAASPGRRRLGRLLGRQLDGVLGQADRVVRTARQGFSSLPNVTVEAHVGEHSVSKTLGL